jgi:hypothetical protein
MRPTDGQTRKISQRRKRAHLAAPLWLVLGGAMLSHGSALLAQSGPDQDTRDEADFDDAPGVTDGDVIIVRSGRLPQQLDVPQAPLVELDPEDIAGFGAGSIAELVTQLEPATGSARGRGGGRPVFLINGIRVSSFREFFRYPPEALRRVEVLPEEVAQRFGFPPDRRVMNFILKKDFASREIEAEYEQPDRGGYSRTEQEFGLLQIAGEGRLNLNFEHNDTSLLTESERSIIQTPGSEPSLASDPDPAEARSLVADARSFELRGNWARAFTESGSTLSITANLEREESLRLFGLDSAVLTGITAVSLLRTFNADDPLRLRSDTDTASLDLGYTRQVGDWQLTGTLTGSLSDSRSRIDRPADTAELEAQVAAGLISSEGPIPDALNNGLVAGFDTANTQTRALSSKVTLRGRPVLLPAGELGLTFDLGYSWDRITSDDTRSAVDTRLNRGDIEGGVNIALPLTSRSEGFLGAVGDFSANFQAGFNDLSDFGTLYDWSAGLNWEPFDDFQLSATYVSADAAPSLAQLGNPEITNFNVAVFDFARGETELVTFVSGGNPELVAEQQRDWKFSANWRLPTRANIRLNADYVRNRSENVSASFPALTENVEAAFADRVTRDASGRLIALDARPVTFAETRSERVSIGLNLRGRLGGAARGGARGTGRGTGQGTGQGTNGSAEAGAGAPRGGASNSTQTAAAQTSTAQPASAQNPNAENPNAQSGNSQAAPAARQRRGGPAAMFGRGRNRGGRYFLSLTHNIELDNTILIAPLVPVLDQLEGDATSTFGLARHTTRLSGGLFKGGVGIRVIGNYAGKARINGSGEAGTSDLLVSDLATVNLRLFADLGRVLGKEEGVLQGLRLSLRADNLFDGRRIVRDEAGDIPLRFQPLLIDPTGRYLGIQLRKLF